EVEITLAGEKNLNFLTDFFEVDHAVNATTTGTLTLDDQERDVTVVWTREAGETAGSVRITFSSPAHQIAELTFTSAFEIFQYRGTLAYTPATEIGRTVEATIDLTRVGGDTKFTGPMPMTLTDLRTLYRESTDWTGPGGETFSVLGTTDIEGVEFPLDRLANRPWYVGSFFFLDGVPSTPFQDEYDIWDVFIFDPNDADEDGVPDLTDPDIATPGVPPSLTVTASGATLQLSITGTPGSTATLEQKATLNSGAWSVLQTITFSTAAQSVTIDPPASGNAFYRVVAP
ncbi:MAG: hypothetical protein KIT22_05860, partial [Verrucomicrobiae bacterium]|nr:hypothetical protein [Verrucomicrobiae bacterium]